MNDSPFYSLARDDFGKLRKREVIARMLSLLKAQKTEMLSLGDVRSLLKPESETYRGMRRSRSRRSWAARAGTRISTGRSCPGTTS